MKRAPVKVLVYHGPNQLAVEDRPDPAPGTGEVLIDVIATGICGSDLHGYTGENGRRVPGQVMGHETVGRVSRIGADVVSPPSVGDIVTIDPVIGCGTCPACLDPADELCPNRRVIGVDPLIVAAFAEQIVVPSRNVVVLPKEMPVDLGALVEPLSVGFRAASRGDVTAGSAVLVIGGGPIGQAAALGARRLGGRVVVSEISPSRAALVMRLGFAVVNPAEQDLAAAVEATLGRRPDVVIDAVALSSTLGQALAVSAPGATVVLVGMGAPAVELDAYRISTEERTVIGSFCYTAEQFRSTAAWVADNASSLEPLIDGSVSLHAAPRAFADLADGSSTASKILVRLGG
ncbi:zinc-dependent alcohol dehydrogenase [Plantibacter sp. YIM 135249]|uniref:zinc-dependent alcohol dehydrogenase n=1 Tax=Plantibacter sp. YIM 135249 TaxID=3423918 RepID=UPI003D326385